MTELNTQQQMISQAYGIYLKEEHGLEFSTRDSYRTQRQKNDLEKLESQPALKEVNQ